VKTSLQALVFALLLGGILAALSYPGHSTTLIAMGDGGAPTPACSPWDSNCDPGPAFANDSAAKQVGEGSSPMPMCSPWDDTCTPGPAFPKPHAQPVGEGSCQCQSVRRGMTLAPSDQYGRSHMRNP
jgi:hypothetical protein